MNKKMADKQSDIPLVRFGIVADIQYANYDDLLQYGRIRYYRNSLNLLKSAINDWKIYEKTSSPIRFILSLGDLVDAIKSKTYLNDLDLVLNEMNNLFENRESVQAFEPTVFHIWGNHEVYGCTRRKISNMPKMATAKSLKQNLNVDKMTNYYWHDITDRLRLICLDLYEISPLGYDKTDEIYQKSTKIIENYKNLYDSTNNPQEKDYFIRFRVYGGAASETQLEWLKNQLQECARLNKKILLAGHIPLLTHAGDRYVAWNADDILKLIWSFDKVVLAYLCGHAHVGHYYLDEHGIHHLTVSAILETPPNSHNSYVSAEVYLDKLVINNQNPVGGFIAKF